MASSTVPASPIRRREPMPSEPPSRSSRRASGRRAANAATETPTNAAHSPARPTSANARADATTAPTANGARKNAPGVAISPMPNSTAAPSQIQRHCSGSSMAGRLVTIRAGRVRCRRSPPGRPSCRPSATSRSPPTSTSSWPPSSDRQRVSTPGPVPSAGVPAFGTATRQVASTSAIVRRSTDRSISSAESASSSVNVSSASSVNAPGVARAPCARLQSSGAGWIVLGRLALVAHPTAEDAALDHPVAGHHVDATVRWVLRHRPTPGRPRRGRSPGRWPSAPRAASTSTSTTSSPVRRPQRGPRPARRARRRARVVVPARHDERQEAGRRGSGARAGSVTTCTLALDGAPAPHDAAPGGRRPRHRAARPALAAAIGAPGPGHRHGSRGGRHRPSPSRSWPSRCSSWPPPSPAPASTGARPHRAVQGGAPARRSSPASPRGWSWASGTPAGDASPPTARRSTADRNRGTASISSPGWRLIRSASCRSTPTPTTSRPRGPAPWPSTTPRACTRSSCAAPAGRRATSSTRPWTCPR